MNKSLIQAWVRKNRPYGREKLASQLGVSFSSVSHFMQKKSLPKAKTCLKLAQILGVPLDELLERKPSAPKIRRKRAPKKAPA